MEKEKVEIKEEVKTNVEKPKKKTKIIKLIILAIIIIALGVLAIIFVPKIKEEGIQGVLNPTNLDKKEKKYYDLYVTVFDKYKDLKNDDENIYGFNVIFLEGVDEPVLVLHHDINKQYVRRPREEVTLFYIKDGKVVEKKYGENSNIKPYYNIEKDEIDYYLYQIDDAQEINSKMTITLLKDIVTECSDPYVIKLTEKDYFTAISNKGVKTSIQKVYFVIYDSLENYLDSEKYRKNEVFIADGYKSMKHQLKKAIDNKFYLKDVITDHTWEIVKERLSEYTLKRGQKILSSSEVSGGSCATVKEPEPGSTTPDPEVTEPDSPEPSKTTPEPSKPTTKCNDGFVYVSDDKRCYNSKKTKSPQQKACMSGYTDFGPDCAVVVDSSNCESGNDQYGMMDGKCVDNSTVYNNFPVCPSGYEYLWGSYGGQEFNGDCYKWEKPNY